MNPNPIAAPLRPFLCACVAFALISGAQAQLSVDMRFEKKTFVDHEPIQATVTVKNLAGHDVILSSPGSGAWVNFDVQRSGSGISKRPDALVFKPFVIKAGGTIQKKINLGQQYPLGLPSTYAVTANVYYPPLKKYFSSKRTLIYVTRAKTFWSRSVGVNPGNNQPIVFRKYSLMLHRDHDSSSLYVRISSDDDTLVYSTYSLGGILSSFDPNVDIDGSNRLHVLHMLGPKVFTHSIIDTDGSLERSFHKETARSRPRLRNRGGTITVSGGVDYDPNDPYGTRTRIASPAGDDANRIRSGNERPEGLPLPR